MFRTEWEANEAATRFCRMQAARAQAGFSRGWLLVLVSVGAALGVLAWSTMRLLAVMS
jgi:hypothetical protein